MTDNRKITVNALTRVEGEGKFVLRHKDGEVLEASLSIFEAPRFFESFLRGREPDETVDIVARICGICPVAYQVGASRAFERAFGIEPTPAIADLRRPQACRGRPPRRARRPRPVPCRRSTKRGRRGPRPRWRTAPSRVPWWRRLRRRMRPR